MVTIWLLQVQNSANSNHKIQKLKIEEYLFINTHTIIQYETKGII